MKQVICNTSQCTFVPHYKNVAFQVEEKAFQVEEKDFCLQWENF